MGFVEEWGEEKEWAQIRTKECREELKRRIQKQSRKWGIKVSTVKIKDLAETRVYRIFGGM